MPKKSCFNCNKHLWCSLFRQLDRIRSDHLDMLNVESNEKPNCVTVFAQIAECCKVFELYKEKEPE